MTLQQFSEIFALLAVQLRFSDADEATIRGYYRAMKDLEPELVAMTAEDMAHRGGASGDSPHWFPKTSEWVDAVQQLARKRQELLTARIRELHKRGIELCTACADTGWEMHGDGAKPCSCRKLRRLEVLGRLPMPELLPETSDADPPMRLMAAVNDLARTHTWPK